MARKRFTAEQIIMKLREAEVGLAQGRTVGQVSKQIGVTGQTYYRWRKEYGGLWRRLPIRYGHLDLSQHRYDLFRFVPLHWHLSCPPL